MSSFSKGGTNSGGYNESEARYPGFISFMSRYNTFGSWPHNCELQSARNMALAGFYYMGSSDRARCFYCGLTLRDWDSNDDPFPSHRQWSPHCGYISTIADQQLNSSFQSLQVTENRMTSLPGFQSTSTRSAVSNSGFNNAITTDSRTCSDSRPVVADGRSHTGHSTMYSDQVGSMNGAATTVDCPDEGIGMESTVSGAWRQPAHVQAVLEMGYSMDVIERTIDRRRREGRGEFSNASSLMAAIEGWD